MKAKTKALLREENEYLKRTLAYFIRALKESEVKPFISEIAKSERGFTEYHKVLVGELCMHYNLYRLYDLKDTSIAHEINEIINKR